MKYLQYQNKLCFRVGKQLFREYSCKNMSEPTRRREGSAEAFLAIKFRAKAQKAGGWRAKPLFDVT